MVLGDWGIGIFFKDLLHLCLTLFSVISLKKNINTSTTQGKIRNPSNNWGYILDFLTMDYKNIYNLWYRDTVLKVCVKNGPSVTDVWEDRHGQVDWIYFIYYGRCIYCTMTSCSLWDISHILLHMCLLYYVQFMLYNSFTSMDVYIVNCTI